MSETTPDSTTSEFGAEETAVRPEGKGEASAEKTRAEKSFAETVEQTLRGFLDFVFAYSKTLVMALFLRDLKHYREERFTRESKLIRPLTFLCCSYIPCAVILQASATSFWDVLTGPENAIGNLATQLSEISPTKILLGSIPVLISIYLGSSLLAYAVGRSKSERDTLRFGMCYGFGVQFASTALFLAILFVGHARISEQLLPHFVIRVLDVLLQPYVVWALILAAAAFPFLVAAVIIVNMKRHWRPVWLASIWCAVLLLTIFAFWLGGLPARFQEVTHPEAKVSVELYEGQMDTVPADRKIKATLLLRNPTATSLLVDRSSGILVWFKVADGPEFPIGGWRFSLPENKESGQLLEIKAGDTTSVEAEIAPDYEDWVQIHDAKDNGKPLSSRLEVANANGGRTDGDWVALDLQGELPSLSPSSPNSTRIKP